MGPYGRIGTLNLQDLFLLDPDVIYLNHGSFGACPRPVFDEYQKWQMRLETEPVRFMREEVFAGLRQARIALGNFLHCSGDDLVLVPNPTTAINTVIRSLNLRPGDEILTTNHEYGALNRAWERFCTKTNTRLIQFKVELPVTTVEKFVDHFFTRVNPRTKVIFISQITSPTALIFPVHEICARARELGLMTIIDGAHVPGHIPLNIREMNPDIFTGACHKWLCTPKGCSFLYVRREIQSLIEPLVTSWGSEIRDPDESPFIAEHEWQGTRDMSSFLTVPAAIQFHDTYLTEGVKEKCRRFTREARNRLLELVGTEPLSQGPEPWLGQVVSVEIPGNDPDKISQQLLSQFQIDVPVFSWENRSLLRVSIHRYNRQEHIDSLLTALKTLL